MVGRNSRQAIIYYVMMLNEKSKVVINKSDNPARKKISATFSNLLLLLIEPLIDKKERIQLAINITVATVVNSSMIVLPEMFNNFKDVKTTKQIPNKFEDALSMCDDFSLSSLMK